MKPQLLSEVPEDMNLASETDVIVALELLMETLADEKRRLNQEGAKAMEEADYDTAKEVIDFAKLLIDFSDEVVGLKDKWTELEARRDASSPKAREIVSRNIFAIHRHKKSSKISAPSRSSGRIKPVGGKTLEHCFHLLDYVVYHGGHVEARDASEHVNRILPMKWPELRAAKVMMMEKRWISSKLSNREIQITAAGRTWHQRKSAIFARKS